MMKITNDYNRYQELTPKQSTHVSNSNASATPKKNSVEVALSNTSQQLRAADTSTTEVSSDRVAELKKAIQNGTYKVSVDDLTAKMMESFNK